MADGRGVGGGPHLASVVVYTSTVNSSLRTSLYCLVTPGATRIPGELHQHLPPILAGPSINELLSHAHGGALDATPAGMPARLGGSKSSANLAWAGRSRRRVVIA